MKIDGIHPRHGRKQVKPKPARPVCKVCGFASIRAGRCLNCSDAERFAVAVMPRLRTAKSTTDQSHDPAHPWRVDDACEASE